MVGPDLWTQSLAGVLLLQGWIYGNRPFTGYCPYKYCWPYPPQKILGWVHPDWYNFNTLSIINADEMCVGWSPTVDQHYIKHLKYFIELSILIRHGSSGCLTSKSTTDHGRKHEELFLWYADIVEMTLCKRYTKKQCGLSSWLSGKEPIRQCRWHRFYLWSGKIPHATEQLSPWSTTTEPVFLNLEATTTEPTHATNESHMP